MILHHVAQSTCLIVESTSTLDAHILYCRDLHALDVVAIPERLEDTIRKTQSHDILHRLLSEEVIDTIELMFVEGLAVDLVQLSCRLEVISEGLLDDDTSDRRGRTISVLFALFVEPDRSQVQWDHAI